MGYQNDDDPLIWEEDKDEIRELDAEYEGDPDGWRNNYEYQQPSDYHKQKASTWQEGEDDE